MTSNFFVVTKLLELTRIWYARLQVVHVKFKLRWPALEQVSFEHLLDRVPSIVNI